MNLLKLVIVAFYLIIFFSCEQKQTHDVERIINAMTLNEKLEFIGGYDEFNIRGYEHLGIPEIHFADGPVGVRNYGKSTAYPASVTLAASWNKNIAHNIGKAIALEAKAKNIHVMLGPGMNIYRFPLCGRNFEYLGEDPYLAGQIAKEYILGMQNEGVMAVAKHYVANNQEFNRHHCSSDIDERTLHEIYLPAFKTSVQEAKVASIMTAYNLINGVHASEHSHLNNKILKGDWDFNGFIMSDWRSTYDGVACAKGGLDLEMPSGKYMHPDTLSVALAQGELYEDIIDDKIRRILNTYKRFGLFEKEDISTGFSLDSNFVRYTAIEAAREGMVLLKNTNSTLPLKANKIKNIAVIGPNGYPGVYGAGGSSEVTPLHSMSLLSAIEKQAGKDIEVVYEKGVYTGVELPQNIFDSFNFYINDSNTLKQGVKTEFYANKKLEGEILLKTNFSKLELNNNNLAENHIGECSLDIIPKNDYSIKFNCSFSPNETAYYCFAVSGDDGYRLFIDGEKVIDMWWDHGETAEKYECKLQAGKEYDIELQYYQAGGGASIKMGALKIEKPTSTKDYLANAIVAAKKADVVVMSVGHFNRTECEGFDRSYEMPFNQSELISAVAEVNNNVVVVLNAGGNIEMESWIHKVNSLLMAWYPGQEGNIAAAEILFGHVNPSGKLPASFEYKIEDNPAYDYYWDHDNDLRVDYSEGIFLGYRYFDKVAQKPRFPFGYGLSYTEFEYSEMEISKQTYGKDDTVKVNIRITNIGDFDGSEVIQLYVSDKKSLLPRPLKELKAFDKIYLKKGETKSLEFELNADAFSYYDPDLKAWVLEKGEFEILTGGSSVDIRQTKTITIN